MVTQSDLDNYFSYHEPTADQKERYARVNTAAKNFAVVVLACTPESADQTAAVRQIREAKATANSAIACEN